MEQLTTLETEGPVAAIAKKVSAAETRDRRFCTEHLMDDLKGRSVRGGAVTMAAQVVQFTLRFVSIPILSRLLTPEDFGLVAMVTAVTGFVGMFKDAGLSMATVQRAKITHEQVSTLFWINVALSVLLMLITAALAPLLAWFYHEPRLVGITLALATTFLFGGLSIQHGALLTRQMRFNALAVIRIVSLTASVVVAVAAAYWGAAYWSLIIMTAVELVVTAFMTCTMSGWWPGLPSRGSGVRPMLAFGGGLTGAEAMGYLAAGIGNSLVGWWWGAAVLGLYSQAVRVLALVNGQLTPPLRSVAMPALSRLQDRPEELARYYLRLANIIGWLCIPSAAFLILTADDFVRIVFGPQWGESVTAFRMFGPVTGLLPLYYSSQWLLISSGRTDRAFYWSALGAALVVLSYAIGVSFGINGVAGTFAVIWLAVTFPFSLHYAFHNTRIHMPDLFRHIVGPIAVALLMSAFAFAAIPLLTNATPLARMLFQAVLAGVGFLVAFVCIPKLRKELNDLVRSIYPIIRRPES